MEKLSKNRKFRKVKRGGRKKRNFRNTRLDLKERLGLLGDRYIGSREIHREPSYLAKIWGYLYVSSSNLD